MIFKTAILQTRSRNRDIEGNISIIIEKMKVAKRNNADILLLPECFITGYDLTIGNASALTTDDLKPLCEKANLRSYREREMLGNTFRKVKAYAPLLDDRVEYPFVR